MNCRKLHKLLPLLAGDDLPERRMKRIESHLSGCEDCRRELEILKQRIQAARIWLQQEELEWSDPAWRRALREAAAPAPARADPWKPWPFRPLWAYAAMALLAAALTLWVVKPLPEKEGTLSQLAAEASAPSQEIVSMTLVSRETGLEVQWFLNKNFKLKEDSE